MSNPIQSMNDADALGEEYGVDRLLERAGLTRDDMVQFALERVTKFCQEHGVLFEDDETFTAAMTLTADAYLMGVLHGKGQGDG